MNATQHNSLCCILEKGWAIRNNGLAGTLHCVPKAERSVVFRTISGPSIVLRHKIPLVLHLSNKAHRNICIF